MSTTTVHGALLHMCPALGDVSANLQTLQTMTTQSLQAGAKLVIAPELATTGYSITAEQVRNGLGFTAPYNEFNAIKQLAVQYSAYVTIGFAEIGEDNKLYNSALLMKPDGTWYLQRKRGVAMWNEMGNTPFDVVQTPYGKVGVIVCSDTYLMDWPRIVTLKEADIVLAPANWWGNSGQIPIWTTRTLENGVFFLVANRWGIEVDTRDPKHTYTYDMNDAPSAVVDMSGDVLLSFKENETERPYTNHILAFNIDVPVDRINGDNKLWSVVRRVPNAYVALANPYYVRATGNQPLPGLPPAGITKTSVMAYVPSADSGANLDMIMTLYGAKPEGTQLLLLPPNGLTQTVALPDAAQAPWNSLVAMVRQNGIQLLITSTPVPPQTPDTGPVDAIVTIQQDGTLTTHYPINDPSNQLGNLRWPIFYDLPNARIGIVSGSDDFFPETTLSLAKKGADIVLTPVILPPPLADPAIPEDNETKLLKTRTNDCVHIAVMKNSATGFILINGGGFVQQDIPVTTAEGMVVQALDSSLTRTKYLNSYYGFDLETLIGDDEQVSIEQARYVFESMPEPPRMRHSFPPGHPLNQQLPDA